MSPSKSIAILGAGPVGIAAFAEALERGHEAHLFERSETVGGNFKAVAHVRLFSNWAMNIAPAVRKLLDAHGWFSPKDEEFPTPGEMITRYMEPFARLPGIASRIHLGSEVVSVTRKGLDKVKSAGRFETPFLIRVRQNGKHTDFEADVVIDATGTWQNPNPLGANGLEAIGESALLKQIAYGMPDILGRDRLRYAEKTTLVAGSGHSAMGSLISLAELGKQAKKTRIIWAIRATRLPEMLGDGTTDGLPARGKLAVRLQSLLKEGRLEVHTGFRIRELRQTPDHGLRIIPEPVSSSKDITGVDEIICATGARPDHSLNREIRLKLDPWLESTEQLAPLIDPNVHSCGSVPAHGYKELRQPENDFYIVGAKSYGRAPNFLMATGYEQVCSVVAAISGDFKAAEEVHLSLPETGVCSSDYGDGEEEQPCSGREKMEKSKARPKCC